MPFLDYLFNSMSSQVHVPMLKTGNPLGRTRLLCLLQARRQTKDKANR